MSSIARFSKALRAWLVHLYPRSWRERYAEEFEALLEQCLGSPLDVVDIILGALDAHLQLLNGDQVSWRWLNMLNKLRTTILMVFAAYIGYIVAGMALVGLVDDSPMIPLMGSNLAPATAWRIIEGGAMVALLAVVIGGMPLAITVIRRALTADRRNLKLLLVPVYSLVALGVYLGFIFMVGTGRIHIGGVVRAVTPDNFPLGNKLILAGLMVLFILGAIASTLAVWRVVTRTDVEKETFQVGTQSISIRIYKFAYIPAIIATLSMLVMLGATLVWSWLVFTSLPQVFSGDFGLWQTSTQAWLFGILAVMVICSAEAIAGLARGRSAMVQA